MAKIKNKRSGEVQVLFNQHTVGRDSKNLIVISEGDVSRKHAIIYWENRNWFLTDFSSNGTKVNKNLVHHATQKLRMNDVIQFARSEVGVWELIDSKGPCSFLKSTTDSQKIIDLENGMVFPGRKSQCTLFRDKYLNWILDDGKNQTILRGGGKYRINNDEYVFVENECQTETLCNIDITENACFHLILSEDEESVVAQIRVNDLTLDLGNRSYNQLLLFLARERKKDLEQGIGDKNSGWVLTNELNSALSKEVLRDVDEYYINNLIYRLRKSLLDLEPWGHLFADIVERERGRLRLGMAKFKIEKEQMYA